MANTLHWLVLYCHVMLTQLSRCKTSVDKCNSADWTHFFFSMCYFSNNFYDYNTHNYHYNSSRWANRVPHNYIWCCSNCVERTLCRFSSAILHICEESSELHYLEHCTRKRTSVWNWFWLCTKQFEQTLMLDVVVFVCSNNHNYYCTTNNHYHNSRFAEISNLITATSQQCA